MGFVRYVSLTGAKQGQIRGEPTKNKGHNWSEIASIEYKGPADRQVGGVTSKRQHNPLVIVKSGSAPPQLMMAMQGNEILTEITIEVWDTTPSGVGTLLKRITLKNATVTGIQPHIGGHSAHDEGPGKFPFLTEISFNFKEITTDCFGRGATVPDDWLNGS